MSDIIIKVGQLWRMKEKVAKSSMRKVFKEHPDTTDYHKDAIERMAFELKLKIISIESNPEDKTDCYVTVEDINRLALYYPIKMHLGALLKEYEIDEFSE